MEDQQDILKKRFSKTSVVAFYVGFASSIFAIYIAINVWYARSFYEVQTPVGYVLDKLHYIWFAGGIVALLLGIVSASRKSTRSFWSILAILLGLITVACFVGIFLYFRHLNATFYHPCPAGSVC